MAKKNKEQELNTRSVSELTGDGEETKTSGSHFTAHAVSQ